ncbi:hypothetical protein FPHYL_13982 [Fusarium phyllophilum]|uniref:Uncharacterized protein n=1 Tax=Fusarium phyllophilum TaxID=47803 RepID=A0A8H5I7F4_9HYPO|nr:hypothetical protein FPHYL_13982 [Fusarium phyllophilum]
MVRQHYFPESESRRVYVWELRHTINIITYVLPMSTFNGIVSEFPDIRKFQLISSSTPEQFRLSKEYIWELRHTNRLQMSTFNGIVSEFPDIRIDFFRRNAAHNRRLLVS